MDIPTRQTDQQIALIYNNTVNAVNPYPTNVENRVSS